MVIGAKKLITLTGRLLTPIITPRPFYKKSGCWVKIVRDLETEKKAKLSVIGKLVKGERRAPTLLRGFRGFVKVSCVDTSEERAQKRIELFLSRDYLGSDTTEGFGKVQWLDCHIEDYQPKKAELRMQWKFRKGLPPHCSPELQRLILALLLHDFVHTDNHQSKIYEQVAIEDEEIREACLHHHGCVPDNPLVPLVQYYDQLAAALTRKKPSKVTTRYLKAKGAVDFKQLAKSIEHKQQSAYTLYRFIYQSTVLARLVESLEYGRTEWNNLRTHLLVMVNLAIHDYCAKRADARRLLLVDGKLRLIFPSATGSEEATHASATDAEMHLSRP